MPSLAGRPALDPAQHRRANLQLDRAFHDETAADSAPLLHANIRGRTYYR
jgi:hypothetical protein